MKDNVTTPIFSLDIGTRSIVGLLLQQSDNDMYEILDIEILEHDERSMLDGQIHNVLSVAETIIKIKDKLEARHGTLKKVCVAAAGRSLKTKRAKVDLPLSGQVLVNRDDILHLELSAVQQAQFELAQEFDEQKSFNYFCVGYSVLDYRLDGERIGSLVDQTGTTATVEVIATFLPKVVVESLIAALSRADLELEALTLEPIAAINVLIPQSMRRLNVALVDIGAGTSDIAITDEGTIVAYGMVPVAGDEVTEALSDHYLLDFPDAEVVKRQLSEQDVVTITDILGFETEYKKEDMVTAIESTINELATAITTEIIELNQKPPKAVMLVGGGSMTPNLGKLLAEKLQLPENRVAIRGIDAIKTLKPTDKVEAGPELVTPIGIAIASKESPIEYISITVNDMPVRLFDIKQLTVGDGLLAAGIELSKLYGKPGLALMLKVNGRLISIPGEHGTPPVLTKNGEQVTLQSPLYANDSIFVEKGQNGTDATATILDLIDSPTMTIHVNKKQLDVPALVYINNKPVSLETTVAERDEVVVKFPETIEEVFDLVMPEESKESYSNFTVSVNHESILLPSQQSILLKNDKKADLTTTIEPGDSITIEKQSDSIPTMEDVFEALSIQPNSSISVFFNESLITITKPKYQLKRNEVVLREIDPIYKHDELHLETLEDESFIFQDVFRHVDFTIDVNLNKRLIILRNGKESTFTEPITTGDKLEVKLVSTT